MARLEPPARTAAPSSHPTGISPPPGLAAWRLDVGTDAFALLEWPAAGALDGAVARLTRAEADVACRVVRGWSNARIARERGCSPRTVANQIASTFRKLGVRSRLELYALLAREPPCDAARPR